MKKTILSRDVLKRRPRAVLYMRQSLEKEETISDEIQEAADRAYCARQGYEVVHVVWEQHTGRIWHKRKGVQEAMAWLREGRADVIVLWQWNRLSRRRRHWILAETQAEEVGGRIEAATEEVDLKTASGRFNRNIHIDFAEYQSDQIGEVWKETHAVRRARGLPATGRSRYGYNWIRVPGEPERYEIRDDQAQVLKWAYQSIIDGMGFSAVCRDLNARGISNTYGRPWIPRTLTLTLDSGFAAGLLVRVPVDAEGERIHQPFRELVWDVGAQPRIIDPEMWEAYRTARMAAALEPPRTREARYVLSGLVRCGDCGYAMTRSTSNTYGSMRCREAILRGLGVRVSLSERKIIRAILAWLAEIADEVSAEADRLRDVQALAVDAESTRTAALRNLASIDRQMMTLTRQHIAEVIPEAVYIELRDHLLAERTAAELRLAEAEQAVERSAEGAAQAVTAARGLLEEWETLAVPRRRAVLRRLIRTIWVIPAAEPGGEAQVRIEPVWAPKSASGPVGPVGG